MASSLEAVVAAAMEVTIGEVTDDLGPATTGQWTSLRHVQLMSAVQRTYGIRLEAREMRSVRNVGHLRELLRTKGVV